MSNYGRNMTTLKLMLASGLMLILSACQSTSLPVKPQKPALQRTEAPGLVCYSEEEARKLARYILQLEAGYTN